MRVPWRSFQPLAIVTLWVIPSSLLAQPAIEIEINNTATDGDDYIGWCPVPARARLTAPAVNRDVKLTSTKRLAGGTQGEVVFAAFTAARPKPDDFTPLDPLTLTLPGSGAWKPFWVAGKEASSDGKDVKIVVQDAAGGASLIQFPLMVRIRKNAESLTPVEIERFLRAIAILHDLDNSGANSKYLKYVHVHAEAFFMGIHGVPAFAPWHRSMLLSFERELQEIDPRVALPYWQFHENAPRLFTEEFIGVVSPGLPQVTFSSSNPLDGWAMPADEDIAAMVPGGSIPTSVEPMLRVRNAATSHPNVDLQSVLDRGEYETMNEFLEDNYHNGAHSRIGGWLGQLESPKDPLFFLLHANVDRAWAQWQKEKHAHDPGNVLSYFPQDGYPGAGAIAHQGSYADDTQWPWNNAGGNQGNTDPNDDWPSFIFSLPSAAAGHGPSTVPLVKELIDYHDVQGDGLPHGTSYDSIKWAD